MQLQDYHKRFLFNPIFVNNGICNNPECENSTNFISLRYGFAKYCTLKCKKAPHLIDLNKTEDYRKRSTDNIIKQNKTETAAKRTSIRLAGKAREPRIQMQCWLSYCQNKNVGIGFLYIAYNHELIKVGISIEENARTRIWKTGFSNFEVFTGNVNEVANVECIIKESFKPVVLGEWFNIENKDQILAMIYETNLTKV